MFKLLTMLLFSHGGKQVWNVDVVCMEKRDTEVAVDLKAQVGDMFTEKK